MTVAWLAAAARWALAAWALVAPRLADDPGPVAGRPAEPTISGRPLADAPARDHTARRHDRGRRHRHRPHRQSAPPRVRPAVGQAGEPAAATREHGGNGGVATSIGEPGTVHLGDIGPNTHLAVDVSGGMQIADQSGGDGNQHGVRASAHRPPAHHRHRHGHHGHRRHHHHHQRHR